MGPRRGGWGLYIVSNVVWPTLDNEGGSLGTEHLELQPSSCDRPLVSVVTCAECALRQEVEEGRAQFPPQLSPCPP